MKIAVVHDYFTQLGGAERVAEELYKMLPAADLFATVALPDKMPSTLADVPVRTSWMQRLPMMREWYRLYFPLYPWGVASLDLSRYDLVISSSSGYAKGVQVHANAMHVCYCHTPMRWVWSFDSYSTRESFGVGLRRLLQTLLSGLRRWDEGASRQPDHFVANSRVVAERILRVYGRHAEIIEPPIDVNRFRVEAEQGDYYVVLARLVSYKRIDLAVQAFTQMGKRLVVIGAGPAMASLRSAAGPTVEFKGRISDKEVETLAGRCRALIFPGEEDFGMAPLELAASGRPTIAYRAGGAVETVVDGVTGVFFDLQTSEALMEAVSRFEAMEWDPARIREHAERFSIRVFRERFLDFLQRIGTPV